LQLIATCIEKIRGLHGRWCKPLDWAHLILFIRKSALSTSELRKGTVMPKLVNPMDAMKTFEPALRAGRIAVQRGAVDPTVWVHQDTTPNGDSRFSYARFRNDALAAMAIIVPADPYEGLPCFQLGYAVQQHLRKRGYAKEIVRTAITEISAGLGRHGAKAFYLEAMVGTKNIASQKVAEAIFGKSIATCEDSASGEPILQYVIKIEPGADVGETRA
jgi:hypothetical protein